MRIAVCLKQVPDTEGRLRLSEDGRWIDEDDLDFVINESDLYAVEAALRLVEAHDGEVSLYSLGPDRVTEALRKGLALGAHRAFHLADPAFEGGDASATAGALAAAVQQEEYDLVLTGSQSDDAGYGATGSLLAERLGWPHAWLVMGLEADPDAGKVEVVREMEGGLNERFRLALPAVIEVQAGMNQPRYASLKGIMQAKRKPLVELDPDDLGLEPEAVGRAGSRVEVIAIEFPDEGDGAEIIGGDAATAARILVDKLKKEARVL